MYKPITYLLILPLFSCVFFSQKQEELCADVTCEEISCEVGMMPEVVNGDCCPTCVPIDEEICNQQEENFRDFIQNFLETTNALVCQERTDCTSTGLDQFCDAHCSTLIIAREHKELFRQQAEEYAEENCVDCYTAQPCIEPEPPPIDCIEGLCGYGEYGDYE